jgi:SAM-dependent methyltransferase
MAGDQRGEGGKVLERSDSFGKVATAYDRYRPGPPTHIIEWMLPQNPSTVVDLGAGTGAMTKDLEPLCDHVIAVEPDDRMRSVLTQNLPEVEALKGVGESIPLADASADAILASSSWHWMDAKPTLHEVERVLVASGTLGVVWTGPDPEGSFLVQARALLSTMADRGPQSDGGESSAGDLGSTIMDDENRVEPVLRIPDGSSFALPDHRETTWDVALTADELIGLLGTFSWIITMPDQRRSHVLSEARRILQEGLGVSGDVTVDVQYRSEAWRTKLR